MGLCAIACGEILVDMYVKLTKCKNSLSLHQICPNFVFEGFEDFKFEKVQNIPKAVKAHFGELLVANCE